MQRDWLVMPFCDKHVVFHQHSANGHFAQSLSFFCLLDGECHPRFIACHKLMSEFFSLSDGAFNSVGVGSFEGILI
jgi:hypothetical protein